MSQARTPGLVAAAGRTERDSVDASLNPARGIVLGCVVGAGLWLGLLALIVA